MENKKNIQSGVPQNFSSQEYGDKYKDHYFEQYKIYLEMADRVSARRVLANAFFLTINSSIIALLGAFFKEGLKAPQPWILIPLIGAELLCCSWWAIVRSYKRLNNGKFKVIHEMEKYLPFSPYKIEWDHLKQGKNPKIYRPITDVENWVPIFFGLAYFILMCAVVYNLITSVKVLWGV